MDPVLTPQVNSLTFNALSNQRIANLKFFRAFLIIVSIWQTVSKYGSAENNKKGYMPMKKINNESGFTILEVMVSMIILAMSLLLLLNMAMVAIDGNDWSNQATRSTQLLQEKLEELRTSSNLTNGADTVNNILRVWTVTSPNTHLRRIDINAIWENRRGDQLQNGLTAFVRTDSI
jgi:prepilin-type N-terminal cleavage/methylation domain-containing protein